MSLRICGCGGAQPQAPAVRAKPLAENREVHDQRGIREAQLGEIDDHVARSAQRTRQRTTASTGRRAVLVAGHAQQRLVFVEGDDAPRYPKPGWLDSRNGDPKRK
jgi:hypothetical protein